MRIIALLPVLAVLLVLAGCGSSGPKPLTGTAAFVAYVREDGGFADNPRISCTRHACSMVWKDNVFDVHSTWLGARMEMWGVDADERLASIRRLNMRVVDTHRRRVATFACVLHHYELAPWPKGAKSVSYPEEKCVKKLRALT